MTPTLVTALIALIGALTAYIKAHTETSTIRRERDETRKERNGKFEMLEYRILQCEKRGDSVDAKLDKIMDNISGLREEVAGLKK